MSGHRREGMPPPFAAPGSMNVDWEERVNLDRLRTYRLGARQGGARRVRRSAPLLLFDYNNIRYVTSTHIGEWARDKMTRYALLTRAASRTSGTSGRRPSTTGSTARGCRRRTSGAG